MKLNKVVGATSEIWQIFVRDSSSTTGGGLTGLTNASPSLTAYYHRDTDTTATVISLVSMTVGTFTSSGFKEVDSTNMPGWYQFCPPNAALASGAKSCIFHLKGATNMAPLPFEVQLTAVNPDSATAFITGVNSLAPPTNWNLESIDASGRVDVIKIAGTTQTARDIGASVLLSAGTGTGQLDFTSGVVKANLAQILGTALTETAGLLAGGFKKFFNVATPTGTVNSIPDVVAGASGGLFIAGSNAATTANITGNITGNLSGSVGSVTGAVGSVTGNVGGNVTGSVGSVVGAVGSVTGNVGGNVTGSVGSITTGGITTASFASGAINAAAVATDAIGALELAAGAATEIAAAVWDEARSGHVIAGSFGQGVASVQGNVTGSVASVTAEVTADVTKISGDSTAADNAESFFDGTGYAGTNNVIPVVTTTTNLTTNNDKTGYRLSATGVDDVLDEVVEGSYTLRQYLKVFASALLGKLSGGATTSIVIRDTADTKDRITATVDTNGNRTAVTLDAT